MTKQKWLS